MRNLLFLFAISTFILGCAEDTVLEEEEVYSIEGKWLAENAGGVNLSPNTMYEFKNGLRYTYYCTSDCNWESLTIADAIPLPKKYTFVDGMLTVDLNFGNIAVNEIVFGCNGNVANKIFDNGQSQLWRIGTNVSECN